MRQRLFLQVLMLTKIKIHLTIKVMNNTNYFLIKLVSLLIFTLLMTSSASWAQKNDTIEDIKLDERDPLAPQNFNNQETSIFSQEDVPSVSPTEPSEISLVNPSLENSNEESATKTSQESNLPSLEVTSEISTLSEQTVPLTVEPEVATSPEETQPLTIDEESIDKEAEDKTDTEQVTVSSPTSQPEPELIQNLPMVASPAKFRRPTLLTDAELAEPPAEKEFKLRESHWNVNISADGMRYPTLNFDYEGERKDFRDSERGLTGGKVGLGRDFYLGANLFFGLKVEGFYYGINQKDEKKAGPTYADTIVRVAKHLGQYYGGDVAATLSTTFEFKTKNPFLGDMSSLACEPFIELGLGSGRGWNRLDYKDNANTETYKYIAEDKITSSKWGGGFNIIHTTTGYYLSVKALFINMDLTRDTREKKNAGTETRVLDQSITDSVFVGSVGGGYRW
jgi:hypothetical protein